MLAGLLDIGENPLLLRPARQLGELAHDALAEHLVLPPLETTLRVVRHLLVLGLDRQKHGADLADDGLDGRLELESDWQRAR